MKKIFFSLLLLIGAIGANAQTVRIYKAGTMVYRSIDADSVAFSEFDPAIYAFSVSEQKQVVFASGNLQYTQSTNTWAFADNQYDIIGKANITDGALADKIDLFGWSTDNTATPFGVSISDTDADYKGAFVDWGTNTIGTDAPNTWRTLSKDEWNYLFRTRPNADKRNGIARIYLKEDKSQYADGLILLPDDWHCPATITFKEGGASGDNPYADHQTFTLAQWQALEEAGAVFLPTTGGRYGAMVGDMDYGFYWSATAEETGDEEWLTAYTFYIEPDNIMSDVSDRKYGRSVRLVRDVQAPAGVQATASALTDGNLKDTITPLVSVYQSADKMYRFQNVDSVVFSRTVQLPPRAFFVSANKYVIFSPGNLRYTRSTRTWSFASTQYDIIGKGNIADGTLADTIDLFGWSADNTYAPFGISVSGNPVDYTGDFVDWGVNKIGDDAPNTWRTLTEEEWLYLFQYTRWTMVKVGKVLGLLLLPDDFAAPAGIKITILGKGNIPVDYLNFDKSYYSNNVYTTDQFAQLEAQGCVFLPGAGLRRGTTITWVTYSGTYWSATPLYEGYSSGMFIGERQVKPNSSRDRYFGQPVRLVKDMQPTSSTKANGH